jgi:ribosomal protein L40E
MTVPEFLNHLFESKARLDQAIRDKSLNLIDIILSMVMVQGLNSKYDVLKQQLFLDDSLSLQDCKAKILEQAQRIDMEPGFTGGPIVLKAKTSYPPCPHCGLKNHEESKCFIHYPELRPKSKEKTKKLRSELRKARKALKDASITGGTSEAHAWKTSIKTAVLREQSQIHHQA